jgi:hypothetical protein
VTASAILLPTLQLSPLESIAATGISVPLFALLAVGILSVSKLMPSVQVTYLS